MKLMRLLTFLLILSSLLGIYNNTYARPMGDKQAPIVINKCDKKEEILKSLINLDKLNKESPEKLEKIINLRKDIAMTKAALTMMRMKKLFNMPVSDNKRNVAIDMLKAQFKQQNKSLTEQDINNNVKDLDNYIKYISGKEKELKLSTTQNVENRLSELLMSAGENAFPQQDEKQFIVNQTDLFFLKNQMIHYKKGQPKTLSEHVIKELRNHIPERANDKSDIYVMKSKLRDLTKQLNKELASSKKDLAKAMCNHLDEAVTDAKKDIPKECHAYYEDLSLMKNSCQVVEHIILEDEDSFQRLLSEIQILKDNKGPDLYVAGMTVIMKQCDIEHDEKGNYFLTLTPKIKNTEGISRAIWNIHVGDKTIPIQNKEKTQYFDIPTQVKIPLGNQEKGFVQNITLSNDGSVGGNSWMRRGSKSIKNEPFSLSECDPNYPPKKVAPPVVTKPVIEEKPKTEERGSSIAECGFKKSGEDDSDKLEFYFGLNYDGDVSKINVMLGPQKLDLDQQTKKVSLSFVKKEELEIPTKLTITDEQGKPLALKDKEGNDITGKEFDITTCVEDPKLLVKAKEETEPGRKPTAVEKEEEEKVKGNNDINGKEFDLYEEYTLKLDDEKEYVKCRNTCKDGKKTGCNSKEFKVKDGEGTHKVQRSKKRAFYTSFECKKDGEDADWEKIVSNKGKDKFLIEKCESLSCYDNATATGDFPNLKLPPNPLPALSSGQMQQIMNMPIIFEGGW